MVCYLCFVASSPLLPVRLVDFVFRYVVILYGAAAPGFAAASAAAAATAVAATVTVATFVVVSGTSSIVSMLSRYCYHFTLVLSFIHF